MVADFVQRHPTPAKQLTLRSAGCRSQRQPALGDAVSSLCLVSPASTTTALRWIKAFEEAEIATRNPDGRDECKAYLLLTDEAGGTMEVYFRALPDLQGV